MERPRMRKEGDLGSPGTYTTRMICAPPLNPPRARGGTEMTKGHGMQRDATYCNTSQPSEPFATLGAKRGLLLIGKKRISFGHAHV